MTTIVSQSSTILGSVLSPSDLYVCKPIGKLSEDHLRLSLGEETRFGVDIENSLA